MERTGGVRAGAVRAVGAGLVLVLAAGCGSSSGLSPEGKLQDGLAAVVDAADAGDLTMLRSAISSLRATVRSELTAGQITAAKARAILSAAAAVENDAELVTKTAAPAPVVTTPPAPTAAPPTSAPPSPTPTSPPPSPTPAATTPVPTATAVLPSLLPSSPTATGRSRGKRH